MKQLMEFIELQDKRLIRYNGESSTKKEIILARAVKLSEEVGELCSEVLAHQKEQRKEKMNKHQKENLPGEVADVLITTLLLAKSMDVDAQEALEEKIKKIEKRYKGY